VTIYAKRQYSNTSVGGMGHAFSTAGLPKDAKPKQVLARVQIRQTAITSLLSSIFLLALIMQSFTLVAGYCTPAPEAPAGSDILAVPHAIFLMAAQFLAFVGLIVVRFDATLNVDAIQRGFVALYVVATLCAIAFCTEIAFSIIEVVNCETALCRDSKGYLVVEIIAEALFIVMSIWLIVWTYFFSRDWAHGRNVFLHYKKDDTYTTPPTNPNYDESASAPEKTSAQLRATPSPFGGGRVSLLKK